MNEENGVSLLGDDVSDLSSTPVVHIQRCVGTHETKFYSGS